MAAKLSEDQEVQLAQLLAELTDQAQHGRGVDLESVCRSHPDLASDLRELWGTVLVADAIGSSTPTSSDDTQADTGFRALELPCGFGEYELLREIGRGGMGVVYIARQASLNREVAIKMILRDQLASAADRRRFQAEAESAAGLEHPHIVPVYEVGQQDGRPYFCMQYIAGQTLAERLSDGPLNAREAALMLAKIARAIDFAHQRGVLHRDLKPSNIVIDDDGEPHVMDFGLAKQVNGPATLTRTGAVLGTPAYMAPEQAAGARGEVGPQTDVYSLGSMLYHMLTGHPPFQAASPVDGVLMVLEQDPVPPRLLNPKADRDLEMITVRCMQKPADLRYDTAAELADDLEAFLNDEPIRARSGQLAQVMARLFRETHHATVLENWGLLWMWHSLVLFTLCLFTNALAWWNVENRMHYFLLWTAGLGAWASVFWALRRRMGPVTFVERQIAHVWAASMVCIGLLFPVEYLLDLPALRLTPVVALVSGMVFMVKAGILSGAFYAQAFALFLAALIMALAPEFSHLIFGTVSAACFFFPGLKYYRQRAQKRGAD